MDRLTASETIRIPTGVEPDKYYSPRASGGALSDHSIRTPSIVLIHSPSRKNKLNKFQEMPKIVSGKSKIPVFQRSVAPSTFLRTNIYGQPVSASSYKSAPSNHAITSVSFPTDRATYENLLSNATTSRSLPVLPAIGVSAVDQVSSHNSVQRHDMAAPNTQQVTHDTVTSQVTIPTATAYHSTTPGHKQYYHVTNAKPAFQVKAEYNNMLQKYATNLEHQHALPNTHHQQHHHHHSSRLPCQGCGRQVSTQPTLNPSMEQSYVQQWLVDPSHPYQLPPQEFEVSTPAAAAAAPTVPLVFTTPSAPTSPAQAATPDNHKKVPTKQEDIPIRYTQAPTQQIVSKTSGKLLSPEDALKRTLKRKKIPPLTKRNSLRSIFSDASGNLQKIAEEMEEDRESAGQSVAATSAATRSAATRSAVGPLAGLSSRVQRSSEHSRSSQMAGRKAVGEGGITKTSGTAAVGFRRVLEPGSTARTYYALLCRMLVEAGNLVLTTVFNNVYPPISLSDNISKPQVQKSLRRMKSQGILSNQHWELLYPKKRSSVSADSFGSTLLVILLKSICHLSPPYPNGWSDLPLPSDKGLSADLARISWYMKHIATVDSITDEQFSTLWNQLATVLGRLAGPVSVSLIKRIQREVLTHDSQQFYMQALASSHRDQESLVEREKKIKPRAAGNRRGTIMTLQMNSSLNQKSGTFVVSATGTNTTDTAAGITTAASPRKKSTAPPGYKAGITWNLGNGMKQEDRNALLTCYKVIVEEVKADECLDQLLSRKVITKEDKNSILSSPSPNKLRMKELLELLSNRTADAYQELLNAVETKSPGVAQLLKDMHSSLSKQPQLRSTDIRVYMKDYLKDIYCERYRQITPYFWDQRIVTDMKSHYIQLDITDLKGLRSNIPRSRRYPIERLFAESSRPPRVLLEGASGSGKTTYCCKLVYDWSRGDNLQTFDFVIYLDMNRLGSSLEETVYNQLGFYQDAVNLKKEEVMSVLMATQRRILFVLDMYDSVDIHPQLLSLLSGEMLEECSVLITCLPNQVAKLSPLCHKRLINLGLDSTRQEQFIERYALLNRDRAQGYANLVSSTLHNMGKDYEYLMSTPQWLNLLCLLTQNEEDLDHATTPSLLLKTTFSILPFLYSIQQSLPYDPENPSSDVLYALNQLQSMALESVLEKSATSMSYEYIQHKYGCKLLMQLGVLDTYECIKDNKPQQMVTFTSRTFQHFLAALKLSHLSPDQFRKYMQQLLNEPSMHMVCVYFVGCKRYSYDPATNSQLQEFFNLLAKLNHANHKLIKDRPCSLGDYALSLECVNECENRKDSIRLIGQSLPTKIVISPEQSCSNFAIRGLNRIMEKNFSKVSQITVILEGASYFNMNTLLELARSIKHSTSVTQLNVIYSSTELLALFLCSITNDYRANILTLVCESKASPAEKLTASTYTDLKSTISSLSGITSFRLSSCRNSLALRNIVRNLPHTLHSLEITDGLLDSVSALDITAYLDGASALHLLNLECCELSDGATGMSLFKGVRNNKSLVHLRLRGATLNTQAIKILCEALKFNRVLQYLDLRDLELSTQACVSLASMINVNQSLTEIKLSTRYSTSEGLTVLADIRPREGFKLIHVST